MLTILLSMLCTFEIHPFSLGNYLGTSLIIGNLMRIRVPSVQWTWCGNSIMHKTLILMLIYIQ